MSFSIQVLCIDTIDSISCVVLSTESHRVIINCCEGAQRLCVEHNIRLGKISAILFTESSPQCIFGLPGTYFGILTVFLSKLML
jgi:ribonuclease BN (tRNA processing enzyme)